MRPEQALHNMGYRPLNQTRSIWAKPIGYSLLTFELEARRWAQKFRTANNGVVEEWASVQWNESEMTLTEFLAYREQWTYRPVGGTAPLNCQPWDFRTELVLEV